MSVAGEGPSLDVRAMSEIATRRLGAEIRRSRSERDMTLGDLAAATGLSVSMLSMLERGKSGVSVGSLVAIASAIGVSVGDLFQPSTTPELSLVRYENQQELTIGPGVTRRLIQRSRKDGLEVASLELAPGADTGAEMVRHEGQEVVVVQRGSLTVHIIDAIHELDTGDSIRLDAQCPHRFANNGSETSYSLLVVRLSALNRYGH